MGRVLGQIRGARLSRDTERDALRVVSLVVMSWLVSWLAFHLGDRRLPAESIGFHAAASGPGAGRTVGFRIFKQVGSIYLRSVLRPGRRERSGRCSA